MMIRIKSDKAIGIVDFKIGQIWCESHKVMEVSGWALKVGMR
jgi:hypothetical protein